MDIQKEREVFEAYFKDKYPELYNDVFKEDGDDRAIIGYSFAWSAWQAVKAQSDKKIKLLLCDEHLQKCESPTGICNSQYPDEEPCLICLAKEAKAQAVPEWAVIVPRLSANYLFNKVPELGFKHQDEKDTVLYHLNYMASGFKESAKQFVEDNHAKQKAMIEAQEPAK